MVLKYADSILRGFASAVALVLATAGGHIVLGNRIPPAFCSGTALVIVASLAYAGAPCLVRGEQSSTATASRERAEEVDHAFATTQTQQCSDESTIAGDRKSLTS
jgi:hypothetical protein